MSHDIPDSIAGVESALGDHCRVDREPPAAEVIAESGISKSWLGRADGVELGQQRSYLVDAFRVQAIRGLVEDQQFAAQQRSGQPEPLAHAEGIRLDRAAVHPGQADPLQRLCYVHSVPTTEGRLSARMFAPSIGVPEDIANANSTACLAARVAHRNMTRIHVDMGDSLGSPATITATIQQTRLGAQIRVGGAAKVIQTLRLERGELNRTRKTPVSQGQRASSS